MRISFLGNHQVPYSTEQDWVWTYRDLGHEVLEFQENASTTDEIWERSQGCDIFHYVHTHGWDTPGSFDVAELIRRFKDKGIVTLGYHLDYWRGLEREKDVGTHPWWQLDYVFTADGGSNDWYRSKGINHHYVKAGVVKRDCYLGNYREEFACDIAFVGAYGYHPEWPYRTRLIDWLSETYGDRFRRYAGDVGPHGTVRGSDLNDLYASVKVVVGDTLCLGFDHPDYFSDRLFETTGRGGFMIFPRIKGLNKCFPYHYTMDNLDPIVDYGFNDFEELKAKIDWYCWNQEDREIIRDNTFRETMNNHTYHNRVEEIFGILKKDGRI